MGNMNASVKASGKFFRAIVGAELGIGLFCIMQLILGQAMQVRGLEYPARHYLAYEFWHEIDIFDLSDPRSLRYILLSPGYAFMALSPCLGPIFLLGSLIALIVTEPKAPMAFSLTLGGVILAVAWYVDMFHLQGYALSCLPYAQAGSYLANTRRKLMKLIFFMVFALVIYFPIAFFVGLMISMAYG